MPSTDWLHGWKDIASHLGVSVKTAVRWEKEGMKVYRVPAGGRKSTSVRALKSEVDEWMASGGAVHARQRRRWQLAAAVTMGLLAGGVGGASYSWFSNRVVPAASAESSLATSNTRSTPDPPFPPIIAVSEAPDAPAVPELLERGPVGDYFDVAVHFDFESDRGLTAVDISRNGHDALIRGASKGPGAHADSRALHFDGIDDYLWSPHTDGLDIKGAFTVEAVLACAGKQGSGFEPIVDKGLPGASGTGYAMYAAGRDGTTCRFGRELRAEEIPVDAWVHVAYQTDGKTARVFVDGALQAETTTNLTGPATPSPSDLFVGGSPRHGQGSFFGAIDAVRVSRGVVSPVDFLPFCFADNIRLITAAGEVTEHASIQEAVDAAKPGTRIEIPPGHYAENVVVSRRRNVVVLARCGGTKVDQFDIAGSHGVTIRGFEIGAAESRVGIRLVGGAQANSEIDLVGNTITGVAGDGILVEPGNAAVTFRGNHILLNAGDGIRLTGESHDQHFFRYNTVERNGGNGIDLARERSVLIIRNTITRNGTSGMGTGAGYGITASPTSSLLPSDHVTLHDNTVAGNHGMPIGDESSADLGRFREYLDNFDSRNATTCGCEVAVDRNANQADQATSAQPPNGGGDQ